MTEQTAPPAAPPISRAPAELPASQPAAAQAVEQPDDSLVEADLLVEDVSIDGMCGVY